MKLSLLIISVIVLPALAFSQKAAVPASTAPSASSILIGSQSKYSALPIYLDSGKVVIEFYDVEIPHSEAKIFKTAYQANGAFNFEYYDLGRSNSLYTINHTGKVVKTWWALKNKVATPASLRYALSEAAGVSSRASVMIPGLLLPTDMGTRNVLTNITAPAITGTELVNGVSCYKIDGFDLNINGSIKISVWIARQDMLIRKIVTDRTIGVTQQAANRRRIDSLMKAKGISTSALPKKDLKVKSTYTYFPYTTKMVSKQLFEFRPNRQIAL